MATRKLTDFARALIASAREEFAKRRGRGSGLNRNLLDLVLIVLVAPIRGGIAAWRNAYGWTRWGIAMAMASRPGAGK